MEAAASRPTGPAVADALAADLELVLQQILESAPVLNDQDDIHGLPANLKSHAAARQRRTRR